LKRATKLLNRGVEIELTLKDVLVTKKQRDLLSLKKKRLAEKGNC